MKINQLLAALAARGEPMLLIRRNLGWFSAFGIWIFIIWSLGSMLGDGISWLFGSGLPDAEFASNSKLVDQQVQQIKEQINSAKAEYSKIPDLEKCLHQNILRQGIGVSPLPCDHKPMGFVTKANAESSSGMLMPEKESNFKADKPVPTAMLLPAQLFGPTKVEDKCYISQTESDHVIPSNGGMFATDIACNFGEGLGKQAELYAPDLRNQSVQWTVEYKGFDELLGNFIQLRRGDESFYLAHTESKLSVGDKVSTGVRIGQMILNGATTGWHVHVEYRRLGVDGKTWKSERYFTGAREGALDNKRKNKMYNGWKEGDNFYFTHYDLGDVNQNDSSPCIGASGKNLCNLQKSGVNVIALTKDVRDSLGIRFGDKVRLEGSCSGEYQVEDDMNYRFRYGCMPKDGLCIKGDIAKNCSGKNSIYPIK